MDLSNPKLIYFKGLLFVLTGLIACAIILLEYPSLKLALLLMLALVALGLGGLGATTTFLGPAFEAANVEDFERAGWAIQPAQRW